MTYQVTRLDFPGLPNPRVDVRPPLIDRIDQRIRELERPVHLVTGKPISCWPKKTDEDVFLYRLLDGGLMYVRGHDVQLVDGPRIDRSGDLYRWAVEAIADPPAAAAKCRVCDPNEPEGDPWKCPCDVAVDLSEWALSVVINHNNCYSFARRTRWCAGGQGSQPGNRESGNETELREGLECDGLVPATEDEVLNGHGDFVAFFLSGDSNYHFLRLDGEYWTHMPNGYPPIACDADGVPIRRDAAARANLSIWKFVDYFRVPSGTPLDHCS